MNLIADAPATGALRRAALAGALAFALAPAALAQNAISQMPMLVFVPPTNLVLTIDDSGSMTSAFVPDSVGNNGGAWAFTSSDYNRLYYNPNIDYAIPPNAAGQQASYPSAPTAFTAAYLDGFNPAAGTMDLSAAYAPTLTYQPGNNAAQPAVPNTPVGTAAYYFTYNGATGCALPVPWSTPPADSCFTLTLVSTTSGPVTPSHLAAGWDETQNFANWFSFYRTRHLAIASAAAIAMSDSGLATARVAWQGLTTCNDFDSGSCQGWDPSVASVDNRLRTFIDTATSTHRSDFFTWLFRVPAQASTPTRQAWWRAGEYFKHSVRYNGQNSPYVMDPNNGSTSTTELACVNNFQITMTDGQWNTMQESQSNFCGGSTCWNVDSKATTLPDGQAYNPSASSKSSTSIYSDYNVGGLSDIAFYYWSQNLRPDLTGSATAVQPYYPDMSTANPVTGATDTNWPYWNPRNDPATWPHMVNFTIGVGLTGYLTLPGLNWYQDSFGGVGPGAPLNGNGYSNLLTYAGVCNDTTGQVPYPSHCNWPTIDPNGAGGATLGSGAGSAGANAGNVYDLWHAAVDSRGEAFSAESPLDLVTALRTVVTRIEGQARGNSAAAGSSPSLTASTQLYVASYNGADWHGTVTAYPVDPATGNVISTPAWQTTGSSIPAFANRPVFTAAKTLPAGGGPQVGTPGISFNASALTASGEIGYFGTSTAAQTAVVNYLLGDASNEQRNGGTLRNRPVTVLGDFVDSNPVFSSAENFGYQILPAGQGGDTYGAFLLAKAATSRPQMVYAGANDGMLHGFDASTGNELFAYVPHSVVPNLAVLSNPSYAHQFMVDGPVFVGDAFFSPGNNGSAAWHSVLLGTTGAGGPGVFALDVTSPQSFGAASVLWDLDGSASSGNADPNLGYTIGQPIIARLNDGNWAAIFGNGYLSPRSCAVLYIVRLSDGTVTTIDTSGATPGTTKPCTGPNASNGLGSPTLLDLDQNGTTDYVFAGDLQGNLWKFDLSSTNASNWGVAYTSPSGMKPVPLFTAVDANNKPQPIVTAPNLGPSPGNFNSFLVYFSTGKMFSVGDSADTSVQSVYAIQDAGVPITAPNRKTLVQQKAIPAPDNSGNAMIATPYPALSLAKQDGWYIDLPGAGERSLSEPLLIGGMTVFSTVIPQQQPCTGGCGGFIYAVDAFTGNGGLNFLVDASTGKPYDGLGSKVGCVRGLTLINRGSTLNIYASGNGAGGTSTSSNGSGGGGGGTGTGGGSTGVNPPGAPPIQHITGALAVPGRVSWHEVVQ